MNYNLYALSNNITYRREGFGGIIFNSFTKETRFYNHAAAFIIEQFLSPSSCEDVVNKLNIFFKEGNNTGNFINDLINRKIIRMYLDDSYNVGKGYFTDITSFANDRLYAPLGVELELTLKCFRRCGYCAYESSPTIDTKGQLQRHNYQLLLKDLERLGVFYIRFTGGDPLTREDSLDIAEDTDSFNFGFTFASDLTAFKEEYAERLGTFKNLVALQTTLDGPTPNIADELRGRGNFEQVTKGLDLLFKNQVPIIVGTVLTKLNVDSIYKTAKFLSKWNVQYCVSPLYDAGRGRNLQSLIPSDDDLTHAYEQFARAVDEELVRPADQAWSEIAAGLSSQARKALWNSQPWLVRSPDRLLRIDPKGRCYTSIHLKELIGEDVYLGNISDYELLELWNSAPLLNQLRMNHHKNTYYGDVIDIREINIKP